LGTTADRIIAVCVKGMGEEGLTDRPRRKNHFTPSLNLNNPKYIQEAFERIRKMEREEGWSMGMM